MSGPADGRRHVRGCREACCKENRDHGVKKIMNNVPSLGKGIKDVKVDLPKKEVTVVYDSSKNNDANIVKGLASLKVKAEPKKAAAKK